MVRANKWWTERNFKTKKALTDAIRNIIKEVEDTCLVDNEKDLELLIWVLSHHHEYMEKLDGSENFKIKVKRSLANSANKELWIVRDDQTEIDISWTKALSPGGASTQKANLRNAAVQAINYQIINFKDSNTDTTCCLCKLQIEGKIEACHFEPRLNDLLRHFFGSDDEMDKIEIKDGVYALRYFDSKLSNDWSKFHEEQAILKPAHKKCIRQRKDS